MLLYTNDDLLEKVRYQLTGPIVPHPSHVSTRKRRRCRLNLPCFLTIGLHH